MSPFQDFNQLALRAALGNAMDFTAVWTDSTEASSKNATALEMTPRESQTSVSTPCWVRCFYICKYQKSKFLVTQVLATVGRKDAAVASQALQRRESDLRSTGSRINSAFSKDRLERL